MNYTKIEDNKVYYIVDADDEWKEITEISGDDILSLLKKVFEYDFEIAQYKNSDIRNECHNIIYKNLYEHFKVVLEDKDSILDQSSNRYKKTIEKYTNDIES